MREQWPWPRQFALECGVANGSMGKPKIHNQGVNAQIGFWFDRRGDGGHTAPERSAPEKLTPGPAGGRLGTAEGDRRHCRWHARMTAQQYLSIRSAGHIDRIDEAVLVDRIEVLVDRIDEAVLVDVRLWSTDLRSSVRVLTRQCYPKTIRGCGREPRLRRPQREADARIRPAELRCGLRRDRLRRGVLDVSGG